MNKLTFLLAALVVSLAASASQASTVNFDSGSSKVQSVPATKQKQQRKQKVWVPEHRSHGRLVKGHYVQR